MSVGPRTRTAASLTLAVTLLLSLAASAQARIAYVAVDVGPVGDGLQRVETADNTAVGSVIATNANPRDVAITPNGATAYVTSIGDNNVVPVNTATNAAGAAIPVTNATEAAVSPDGTELYVTNSAQNGLVVINTTSNTVATTIPLGVAATSVAVTPDGTKAYVSIPSTDSVKPVNLVADTAGTAITVGDNPLGMAITPDGSKLYVVNKGTPDSVSVIDVATDTAGTPITTGLVADPVSIAITPDGSRAYVNNDIGAGNGGVSVINTTTNAVIGSAIPINNFGKEIAITPDGTQAFVTNSGTPNGVTKINTLTNAVVGSPLATGVPTGIAIVPNQSPTAALSAGPQPAGSATTFNGSASSDPEGTVARFDWNFGDGDTLPNGGATPSHTYDEAGTYNVTLTVTDNEGCSMNRIYTGTATLCNGKPAAEITQQVVVGKASPSLSTAASADVVIGGSVSDTATLAGGVAPTGTITFRLFGPDDSSCSTAPLLTSTKPVAGNGNVSSDSFTPTAVGSYRWTAEYSGDTDNNAATSACNAPGESVNVNKATPSLSTSACCSVALGSAVIRDTATLSGGVSPTGTITFKLFGPNDDSCSKAPVLTSPRSVSGNGSVDSDQFIPTTGGTYRWTAEYSGDAQNAAVTTPCNAEGGSVTVSDSVAPVLTLDGAKKQKLDGAIEVDVSCDEACVATGTGTLTVTTSGGGKKSLAKKTFKLTATAVEVAGGATQTLSYKVPRKAKAAAAKALKDGGKVKAQLTVSASDASGNAVEAKRTVTLTGGR